MTELTIVEAVGKALARSMKEDSSVLVMGEDVAIDGGVFRVTDGLLQSFGPERVIDLPLSESLFVGLAVGLGAQGLRPIIEFQFMGFMAPAIDQLLSHASRLRNRTRGRLSCPMVIRAPYGGGIRAPEHHSESTEALFAHIPGLRVVIPSSPAKAYGLLLSAIRSPDPVVFLEPKQIYRSIKEEVDENAPPMPLDQCFQLRHGNDLTIIAWGAMVAKVMLVAEKLSQENVEAAVIDVSCLKPLDMETILDSIKTTGRCIIVHEAPLSGGWGAEIAAQIADAGLFNLLAPIKRVTGYDTVMPLPKLEAYYLPEENRILAAAREAMSFQ